MCKERKEINYDCDLTGCVRKFDVCMCDLCEIEEGDNTLGKVRPCVILKSDDINCAISSYYIVAGIKSENRPFEITEKDAEDIVNEKRKVGRILVPIHTYGEIKFIEISQIRMLPSNKVQRFIGHINNDELKNRINHALMELLFSKKELNICEDNNDEEEITIESEASIAEEPKTKGKKPGRKSSFPTGMSKYFELYMRGELSVSEIAKKLNLKRNTVYYYINRYKELHPELVKKYNKLK